MIRPARRLVFYFAIAEIMMGELNSVQLGGDSQARLASAFGARQLITRKVAAAILGVDVKTLTSMREHRIIPGVRTANGEFRFLDADIRTYLAEMEPVFSRSEARNASGAAGG